MFKKLKRSKAFTIIELVIVIVIIGILFLCIVFFSDNPTEKARLSGVQVDFKSFYSAVKAIGLEDQLYLLDDDEFETKLNDYLDIPMQFTDGISAEKDPWRLPYVCTTFRDKANQTFYVMFASKGGHDTKEFKFEDNTTFMSNDIPKVYFVVKQYQTEFYETDGDDPKDIEVVEKLRDDARDLINYLENEIGKPVNNNTLNEYGFYYNKPYRTMISDGVDTAYTEIIFKEDGTRISNEYSDSNYTNLLHSDTATFDYSSAPVIIDGVTLLGFEKEGQVAYAEGFAHYLVKEAPAKPAGVTMNEYGFYYGAKYRGMLNQDGADYYGEMVITEDKFILNTYYDSNYTEVYRADSLDIPSPEYYADIPLFNQGNMLFGFLQNGTFCTFLGNPMYLYSYN